MIFPTFPNLRDDEISREFSYSTLKYSIQAICIQNFSRDGWFTTEYGEVQREEGSPHLRKGALPPPPYPPEPATDAS